MRQSPRQMRNTLPRHGGKMPGQRGRKPTAFDSGRRTQLAVIQDLTITFPVMRGWMAQ